MLTAIRSHWQNLMHGLWFVPGATALGLGVLGSVLLQVDRAAGPSGVDLAFGGTASAAREVLSTIAASVITVAGLAFSITIVTLQLVAGQFSPRAARTFLGDRATQVAAGIFVGIFLYCLLALRAVRDADEEFLGFVPGLTVTVGIALGVLGLGVLLFFINHIAQTIKVSEISARVARETLSALDELYPEPFGESVADDVKEEARRWHDEEHVPVFASRPGFLQRVDLDDLVAELPDGVERVHMPVAPGDFVTEGRPVAVFWPGDLDEAPLRRAVARTSVIDSEREVTQDVAFGLQQLSDIAVRALSTGVNDPSTAVNCIAYLGACVERLAGRGFPQARRRFPEPGVETIVRRPSFAEYAEAAFAGVGRSAARDPRVASALLAAIAGGAAAAAEVGADDRVEVLQDLAERAAGPALDHAATDADRAAIEAALADVRRPAGRDAFQPMMSGH